MRDRLEGFLKELVLTPGLSGFEGKVHSRLEREFRACGLDPITDTLGNIMAKVEGTDPESPVLMVFSHMDSLGFIVKYIDENGFIKLERVGGIPEKVLPATEIQIGTSDGHYLDGVIGMKSHHQASADEKYIVDKYTSLYVDIGAKNRQEVFNQGIDVGSPVVYKPRYTRMLGSSVLATWLDNRGGCAVLMELMHTLTEKPRPSTVWIVASVLEEYNLRGAMIAARRIKPDMAICMDGGAPSDTPDLEGTGLHRMGGGVVMDIYNFHGRGTLNGTIAHPAMVRIAEKAAERTGVRLQRQAYVGGLTDLSYVQFEGDGGIACLDLGFPVRYCHGPCEVSDLNDINDLSILVKEVADSLDRNTDFSR
jgi:putative aminopeptidase FrvX